MRFGDIGVIRPIDRPIDQLRTNGTPSTPPASMTAPPPYGIGTSPPLLSGYSLS